MKRLLPCISFNVAWDAASVMACNNSLMDHHFDFQLSLKQKFQLSLKQKQKVHQLSGHSLNEV